MRAESDEMSTRSLVPALAGWGAAAGLRARPESGVLLTEGVALLIFMTNFPFESGLVSGAR
jgi:hypothetical protein